MTAAGRRVLVCSCEDTMPLHGAAVAQACGGERPVEARQLCRSQTELFRRALEGSAVVTVACTQEAPVFRDIAEEAGFAGDLAFVNVREHAGWSSEAKAAGPKTAALIAAAAEPMPPTPFTSLESQGVLLVYGRDSVAIEAGRRLADTLDVTVMLSRPVDVQPPREGSLALARGTIVGATGRLGAFELRVDDVAAPSPSSRQALVFGPARNGLTSRADILLDLSGGRPLFPAHELRPGYLRADPQDGTAVERAIHEAAQLVGTFDRPRYIAFDADLCAHARSRRTGCTRCLDLCPTGAITPAGDHVSIDPAICAGCGACAGVCPTGAARYALPPAEAVIRRLRTLLVTYAEAGGREPVVLVHDGEHGEDLIDALARFGDGLPAHVLPLRVNEITQLDLAFLLSALALGARQVRLLARARPRHDQSGLERTLATAEAIAGGLGYGPERLGIIGADDPDRLAEALRALPAGGGTGRPSRFRPMGGGRDLLKVAIRETGVAAPVPAVAPIALPEKAPLGRIDVRVDGCTLCLACVSACPVGALSDNPDRPMLRFQEDLCVQCGLCAATCPEKVITLEPRLDLAAWAAGPVVVKEEEPFPCISCGKPFAPRSTIERIVSKLEGRHWMFAGDLAKRTSVLKMCETCRVEVVVNESFDPHAGPVRPAPRTSEDYLRERERKGEDPLG
jgi:ferredoxin